MRRIALGLAIFVIAVPTQGQAPTQDEVTVRVNAAQKIAPFIPIYRFFGYDEPNYTYTENGRKLIRELTALTDETVLFRTHFLLATGDGTASLKWGSTNAYVEDATGRGKYDWTIVDRIFDTYLQSHGKPFVEIGFMPEALSSKPEPYQPTWIPGGANEGYAAGWAHPPRDYAK